MNRNILFGVTLTILIASVTPSYAGWLIFSKPEYRGKIIDAETKRPIEGVVIVAMYSVHYYLGGPAGVDPKMIHVKETLTDEKGEFVIPGYTTLMSPNSYELGTDFIIYKSGYCSYPNNRKEIFPFDYYGPGLIFSKELGSKEKIQMNSKVITITFGVAELPKLLTDEELINATHSLPDEYEKTPILLKAINYERVKYGLSIIGSLEREGK